MSSKPHWTPEEDQFLEANAHLSAQELADKLGRTAAAVSNHRSWWGIPSRHTWRVKTCKICGAPRYEECDRALCETHYLEYFRAKSKESRQRKQVQA